MLKYITSPEEQFPAKVSFSLDPASKFKDTGQMIEELAHHWGVCTSAEESHRLSVCPLFTSPSAATVRKGSVSTAVLGKSWGLGGQGGAEPGWSMW